jgi:hypothetical protein
VDEIAQIPDEDRIGIKNEKRIQDVHNRNVLFGIEDLVHGLSPSTEVS